MNATLDTEVSQQLDQLFSDWVRQSAVTRPPAGGASLVRDEGVAAELFASVLEETNILQPRRLHLRVF